MGIRTTRAIHRVADPQIYKRKHEQVITKRRTEGDDSVELRTVNQPRDARIDANRWLVDCDCGGAAAASPNWPESRCFGCGRIYTKVEFPANRGEIEAELETQSYEPMREWSPGDTLEDIRRNQRALTEMRTHPRRR